MSSELYAAIINAHLEISSHQSDLYIVDSEEARKICRDLDWKFSAFRGTDGRAWIEVPFAYAPFWEERGHKDRNLGKPPVEGGS